MREEEALYVGVMSTHRYFRDFAYFDSGIILWLLVAELLCVRDKTLSELVDDRMVAYPSSGEIGSSLTEPKESITRVLDKFQAVACNVDYTDGISVE